MGETEGILFCFVFLFFLGHQYTVILFFSSSSCRGRGDLNLFMMTGLDENAQHSAEVRKMFLRARDVYFVQSLFPISALFIYPCHSFHMRHSVCDLFNQCLDPFCKSYQCFVILKKKKEKRKEKLSMKTAPGIMYEQYERQIAIQI